MILKINFLKSIPQYLQVLKVARTLGLQATKTPTSLILSNQKTSLKLDLTHKKPHIINFNMFLEEERSKMYKTYKTKNLQKVKEFNRLIRQARENQCEISITNEWLSIGNDYTIIEIHLPTTKEITINWEEIKGAK